MIEANLKSKLISIWKEFNSESIQVKDTRGNDIININGNRLESIKTLQLILNDFITNKIEIGEFKTSIDSFNKKNNLWGFTAIKGQMFFNLLVKTTEEKKIPFLSSLLKTCIEEPNDLNDCLKKINLLDEYVEGIVKLTSDKRKAPNKSSICYFLSYFWQIHNNEKWPVMYSSLIDTFSDLGIWEEPIINSEKYQKFYNINNDIKLIIAENVNNKVGNWEVEHFLWNYRISKNAIPNLVVTDKSDLKIAISVQDVEPISSRTASINIYDYLPPFLSNLIELGNDAVNSSASKGAKFEKAVCTVFKQLGFLVEELGQGSGREPDLIAKYKEDNVGFIIDAKAYSDGYYMGAHDERAIKEYIAHHCPKLQKEGIKRIGFVIVSNSFKSEFSEFISKVTWETDIKRFTLLTTSALLHLAAFKIKDQLAVTDIIDLIRDLGPLITEDKIIQQFDDV